MPRQAFQPVEMAQKQSAEVPLQASGWVEAWTRCHAGCLVAKDQDTNITAAIGSDAGNLSLQNDLRTFCTFHSWNQHVCCLVKPVGLRDVHVTLPCKVTGADAAGFSWPGHAALCAPSGLRHGRDRVQVFLVTMPGSDRPKIRGKPQTLGTQGGDAWVNTKHCQERWKAHSDFASKRILKHQKLCQQPCCRTDWASQFNTIVTIPALYQFSPVALKCWGHYRVQGCRIHRTQFPNFAVFFVLWHPVASRGIPWPIGPRCRSAILLIVVLFLELSIWAQVQLGWCLI